MARIHLLTGSDVRKLRRILRKIDTASGPGVVNTPDNLSFHAQPGRGGGGDEGRPRGTTIMAMRVLSVENDYLVCRRIDTAGEEIGGEVNVAKPPELRHDPAYYEGVDSITSQGAQTIEVEFTDTEIEDEVWQVKPPYIADVSGKHDTEILAVRSPLARLVEVEIDEEQVPLTLVDMNVAGRVWGTPEPEEE